MQTTSPQLTFDKIVVIDFEDSFTYNIASVLFSYEEKISVVSHKDFFSVKNSSFNPDQKCAVILGPGPGHPSEYRGYFSQIEKLRKNKLVYLMGVCLGHQILGLMDKKVIKEAREKIHGQCVEVEFLGEKRLVQRYNSLSVYESSDSGAEIDVRSFERGISYQFHPESVGTQDPEVFFRELINFIHS